MRASKWRDYNIFMDQNTQNYKDVILSKLNKKLNVMQFHWKSQTYFIGLQAYAKIYTWKLKSKNNTSNFENLSNNISKHAIK